MNIETFDPDMNLANRQIGTLKTYSHHGRYSDKKLKEVAADFEAIFINQVLKSMRRTVPKDKMFYGGLKQDIFEDMLYNEYSKIMSKREGFGIKEMIYRFLKQNN